jgi:hypothetical protein
MSAKIIDAKKMRELNESKRDKNKIQSIVATIVTKIRDNLPFKINEYLHVVTGIENYIYVVAKLKRLGYRVELLECDCWGLWDCENIHFAVML